jgi:amino acid transporter
VPLYGAINSFQINQTGNLDIVVSFSPQYWYQVGFVISGLTIAFCIFYIIYDWRRKKEKPEDSTVSNSFEIQ